MGGEVNFPAHLRHGDQEGVVGPRVARRPDSDGLRLETDGSESAPRSKAGARSELIAGEPTKVATCWPAGCRAARACRAAGACPRTSRRCARPSSSPQPGVVRNVDSQASFDDARFRQRRRLCPVGRARVTVARECVIDPSLKPHLPCDGRLSITNRWRIPSWTIIGHRASATRATPSGRFWRYTRRCCADLCRCCHRRLDLPRRAPVRVGSLTARSSGIRELSPRPLRSA